MSETTTEKWFAAGAAVVIVSTSISDKPIRFLIDTHLHGDHTGGNENFSKRGVLIFSRDQLRARLEHPDAQRRADKGAWQLDRQ